MPHSRLEQFVRAGLCLVLLSQIGLSSLMTPATVVAEETIPLCAEQQESTPSGDEFQDAGTCLYVDEVLGFSIVIPRAASVTPAEPLPGSRTGLQFMSPSGQELQVEFGLFLHQKLDTVSIEEWTEPDSVVAASLIEARELTDAGPFTYVHVSSASTESAGCRSYRAFAEHGSRVYFADLSESASEPDDKAFWRILESLEWMATGLPPFPETEAVYGSHEPVSQATTYATSLPYGYVPPVRGSWPISQGPNGGYTHCCDETAICEYYGYANTVDCGAIDLYPMPIKTQLFAPAAGYAFIKQYSDTDYGNLLLIQHDNGAYTWLAHLSSFIDLGEWECKRVEKGDLVALSGETGVGPAHLHWMVRPSSDTSSGHISIENVDGVDLNNRVVHGPVAVALQGTSCIHPRVFSESVADLSECNKIDFVTMGKGWNAMLFSEPGFQGQSRYFSSSSWLPSPFLARSMWVGYQVCPYFPAGSSVGEPMATGAYPDCFPSSTLTTDQARYVSDVTLIDRAVLSPGQSATKTWRVRNAGTSTWGSGYQLVFTGGTRMGSPSSVALPTAAPGQEANVSLPLVAPTSGGTYRSDWRLRNAQGTFFGDELWVQIRVEDATAPAPSTDDIDLTCLNCPVEVAPGTTFRPSIRATVNSGVLLESRGDMLRLKTGSTYGAWPHVAVVGSVGQGGAYTFTFYADNPITAPSADGTYSSTWQVWQNGRYAGDEFTLRFTVRSGSGTNHRPNTPSLVSPHDWAVTYNQTRATLCARANGDQDGDAVTHYYFDIYESAQLWNSGWTTNSCVTTSSLGPYTFKWRVKVRDSRGLESDWSESWRFTVPDPDLTISELYFEPLDSLAEVVRIRACTVGQGSVGVTMKVMVNSAADGSTNGTWKTLKELGVPCFNEIDAPTWNTLEYETGRHVIRVLAHGLGESWNDAAVRDRAWDIRADHRPGRPYNLLPLKEEWVTSRTVTMTWTQTLRTTSFKIQAFSDDAHTSMILERVFDGNTTSFTHTFAQSYPMVYWEVIAYGPYGQNTSGSRFRMDTVAPSSTVAPLVAISDQASFTVNWQGSDDQSGVRWYNVQVKDGSRPDAQWQDWHAQTPGTSDAFVGQTGHTYYFRVRGMDTVGHWENWPTDPNGDTRTTVDASAGTGGTSDLAVISLEPYLTPDGHYLAQVVLENKGAVTTANGFYTDLYVDHLPTGTGDYTGSLRFWVNEPVAPGQRVTLTTVIEEPLQTLAAATGQAVALAAMSEITATLYTQIDSAASVWETDESNNISDPVSVCAAAPDAYEGADDSYQTAPFLGEQDVQARNFDRPEDVDWVTVYLFKDASYVFHTSGLGDRADTLLELYASDGSTLLASNDDAGGLASQLNWTSATEGVHYLRLRQWDVNKGGCGTRYEVAMLPLRIVSPVVLTPAEPIVGEPVTATFTVENRAPTEVSISRLGIGIQGPSCTDWSCDRPSDYRSETDVVLGPGERHTFQMERVFTTEGSGYFGQITYAMSERDWHPVGPRVNFAVGKGLTMTAPATLIPETPLVDEPVECRFTVRNDGVRPVTLPHIGAVGRGPNCTDWSCPWNDFPAEDAVTILPGQSFTYSGVRSFADAGSGYFVEPAFGDTYDWWYPLPGSTRSAFEVSPGLVVVEDLSLVPLAPAAGESVRAQYGVRNASTRTIQLRRLGVGAKGPNCSDWSCQSWEDFPWVENLTLAPGQSYLYEHERAFAVAGDGYFAQILYSFGESDWHPRGQRIDFQVSPGIEILAPLTLSPASPVKDEPVEAEFSVRNASSRAISVPSFGVYARGPDCLGIECGESVDYPAVHNITVAPGQTYTYSAWRSFPEIGQGYVAGASLADGNGWWKSIDGSETLHFAVSPGLTIVQTLALSPSDPLAGEQVTARYTIRNDASRPLTLSRVTVGARGPSCSDWSCTPNRDFLWDEDVTIQPGEQYQYVGTRSFNESGAGYFAQPMVGFREHDWPKLGESIGFEVGRGIEVSAGPVLSEVQPLAGIPVTATYTIRNSSSRAIALPVIGIEAFGPDCSDTYCGRYTSFPPTRDVTLDPGESLTYTSSQTLPTAGTGYLIQAVSCEEYGWCWPISGATPLAVQVRPGLTLAAQLSLNPDSPVAGQETVASYAIRNDTDRDIVLTRLSVASRGPDCLDWSCVEVLDFPWEADIMLSPGEQHTYSQARSFYQPGSNYFAQVLYGLGLEDWHSLGSAKLFQVSTGLEMQSGLTLPALVRKDAQVHASYTIRNSGPVALELSAVGVVVRGPGCSDWACTSVADFPSSAPLRLEPGQSYTYEGTRSFELTGTYSAEPAYREAAGYWRPIPSSTRVSFRVFGDLPYSVFLPLVAR